MDADDTYLWLEDLESAEAAAWVAQRNDETLSALGGDEFARVRDAILEVLESKDRISYPGWRGDGFYYDFWTDADHPRGLWRRTTPEQYRSAEPGWDVLLDIGALNKAEGEDWAWNEVTVLRPGYDRCLISLSHGGSDAVVVREFDLNTRAFVADGFALPEAKSDISWIDEDHIFVGTDFGPGALTSSGYARIVKRWRRGTPLTRAEVVYEGLDSDVVVHARHDPAPGYERDFVHRMIDFFHSERFLLRDGELIRIDVPDDAGTDVHHSWLLIHLRSTWLGHPAGSLLAADFESYLQGHRELTVLFRPDERTALASWSWTRHHLLLTTTRDVRTRMELLTPGTPEWTRQPVPGAGEFDHTWVVGTLPDTSDDYLIASSGHLRPATLSLITAENQAVVLKQQPSFFDTSEFSVRQHFATSPDGTAVPYFVVGPATAAAGPTLLTGYGGFEIPMLPGYDGATGRGWLASGGIYVVANIRGGGEYGPVWHRAALRENRPRAYEDFAAVAADLVTRGITTPRQLGIFGRSNGGLLMGVMLTRYPELFGAVVAGVPLLDMRRYAELLAGRSWVAEYGDPEEAGDWAYLSTFSPYQNVTPDRAYPPALIWTSTRDDRVHPGHARKMAALLREHGHPVTYYENVEGGHGGSADNAQAATIQALTFQFLHHHLGRSD